MPIRINLLAEQQAADELRRRDPVKRATWVAGLLIGVMTVWSCYLQVRLMAATNEASQYESEWKKLESAYKKVSANMEAAAEAERKWTALQTLATNRFLWANPLNALQFVMVTVDDVQLTALKTAQSYAITEAVKPSTNATGTVSRGKPGTSKEKITFNLDGKDTSKESKESRDPAKRSNDGVFKLQEAINNNPYFKTNQVKAQLITRSPDQIDPNNPAKRFSTFTLGCEFPEITR
jgi:hypothetical protein